jgi:hypothetical protein
LTKGASAGAGLPHQEKRRGSLGVALGAIGTPTLFTDGVDLALLDDALHG